jgi:glycosyltransferase involved in cell wall biosynthesis
MPVRNCVGSVERAALSIIRQTYHAWELLIVDDASNDGTWDLVQSLTRLDSRVVAIRNAEHRGFGASLNLAWRRSRYELIGRMDGDDESLTSRLARQASFLVEHPEVAVLGTGAELVDESGVRLGVAQPPEWHDELVRNIFRRTPFIHPSVVMRRSFLRQLGGYDESPSIWYSTDRDLWLRGYRRFRYHNLQEPLIRYRVRRSLSWEAALGGTFVLARAAYREGHTLSRGWYAARFFLAAIAGRARLRPSSVER